MVLGLLYCGSGNVKLTAKTLAWCYKHYPVSGNITIQSTGCTWHISVILSKWCAVSIDDHYLLTYLNVPTCTVGLFWSNGRTLIVTHSSQNK